MPSAYVYCTATICKDYTIIDPCHCCIHNHSPTFSGLLMAMLINGSNPKSDSLLFGGVVMVIISFTPILPSPKVMYGHYNMHFPALL